MVMRQLRTAHLLLAVTFALMLVALSLTTVWAGAPVSQGAALAPTLRAVSSEFGVPIVADPLLNGVVSGELDHSSLDACLESILKPLGYWFQKQNGYYVVGGPTSPLQLLSALSKPIAVSVGGLSNRTKDLLESYRAYYRYDELSGTVMISAPALVARRMLSLLNQPIYAGSDIGFRVQLIDITDQDEGTAAFGVSLRWHSTDNAVSVTGGTGGVQVKGGVDLGFEDSLQSHSFSSLLDAWIVASEGRQGVLRVSRSALGAESADWQGLEVKVEPTTVDSTLDRVNCVTTVELRGAEAGSSKQSLACDVAVPQLAAIIRQPASSSEVWIASRKSKRSYRTFAVLVTAVPLGPNVSVAQNADLAYPDAPSSGLSPKLTGSLGILRGHDGTVGITLQGGLGDLALGLEGDLEGRRKLDLSWRQSDFYIKGRLLAGVEGGNGLLLGIGDESRPLKGLRLSAELLPLGYNIDDRYLSLPFAWSFGARLGPESWGLTLGSQGDSSPEGLKLGFDLKAGSATVLFLEAELRRQSVPSVRAGVRVARF